MTKIRAPYGSWKSPITPELLESSGGILMAELRATAQHLHWIELRPATASQVVVRWCRDETPQDITPVGMMARTRVHEYGGGAYVPHGDTVFFVNFADQRIYRQDSPAVATPITPEPASPFAIRYADLAVAPDGDRLYAVRETHTEAHEAVNDLVSIPTAGGEPAVIASGHDFYAYPRPSPDGSRLAFIAWDHPNMPWDGTVLFVCDVGSVGGAGDHAVVVGGAAESVLQPEWLPGGDLVFISDRSGWWNLHRTDGATTTALAPMAAEFGAPLWFLGNTTYAVLPDGRIATVYSNDGVDGLGVIEDGQVRRIDVGMTAAGPIPSICAFGDRVALVAASPLQAASLQLIDPDSGASDVIRGSSELDLDTSNISQPRHITFSTSLGDAHALFYPPANAEFEGPDDQLPPLVVMSHGGPTGQKTTELDLSIQFFTTRGIAVCHVNYGGSSGYGRAYRERLRGLMGVVDVEDCVAAARHLVVEGEVDGERLAIRGGSAGGWVTLCAVTFHPLFKAGTSYWGISDLRALVATMHKFESHYFDGLVGPLPEYDHLYVERSPLYNADRIRSPLLLIQGLADTIVKPEQSELMLDALRRNGVPCAYLTFEGEGHGLRKAENARRATEAELFFYSKVLGFDLADAVEPVVIENLLPTAR